MALNKFFGNPLDFATELESVNKELRDLERPEFWIDEIFPLNLKDYKFENFPRTIWSWRKRRLILDQLYLIHRDTDTIINIKKLASSNPVSELIYNA